MTPDVSEAIKNIVADEIGGWLNHNVQRIIAESVSSSLADARPQEEPLKAEPKTGAKKTAAKVSTKKATAKSAVKKKTASSTAKKAPAKNYRQKSHRQRKLKKHQNLQNHQNNAENILSAIFGMKSLMFPLAKGTILTRTMTW